MQKSKKNRKVLSEEFRFVGRMDLKKLLRTKGMEIEGKSFLTQTTLFLFSVADESKLNQEYEYAVYEAADYILLCHLASNIRDNPTSALIVNDESKGPFAEIYPQAIIVNGVKNDDND